MNFPRRREVGFNLVAMALQNLNSHASDSERCVAARITESPFAELILYGTVLPGNAEPRARKGESLQTFADELEQQKLDWLRISRDFPTATLVVAGDFNQDLAARHYYGSASKRQRLGQVLDDCDLTVQTAGSDEPIARDSAPRACVDHICIST